MQQQIAKRNTLTMVMSWGSQETDTRIFRQPFREVLKQQKVTCTSNFMNENGLIHSLASGILNSLFSFLAQMSHMEVIY